MTAWKVTFEVDVVDAADDGEAIQLAIKNIMIGTVVVTVEPVDPPPPPSRFGPASRSQDERRP